MPNLSPEERIYTALLISKKNIALRLGVTTLDKVKKVYAGGELSVVLQSIIDSLQEAHDLTLAGELEKLELKREAVARSNTVPNSPPAA